MHEVDSCLYDGLSTDVMNSCSGKGPTKRQDENSLISVTTAVGALVEWRLGPPRDYEIPQPLNRGRNQEIEKYSTLQH